MEETQLMDFPETAAVLQRLADDVKAGYIDKLKQSGRFTEYGKDRLIDTISTAVTVDGRTFTVTMTLNHYWKYVEEGTRPHWPPRGAIQKWVEIKPVIPRPDNSGRIPTPKQLASLIRWKISQKGTEGSHDLQKTKDSVIPAYVPLIEEALRADISKYIATLFAWS